MVITSALTPGPLKIFRGLSWTSPQETFDPTRKNPLFRRRSGCNPKKVVCDVLEPREGTRDALKTSPSTGRQKLLPHKTTELDSNNLTSM
ncbi:hypothetical protein TNCT_674401 [Trichonephila clavata]|uniref:Uncharacterized protein n=1 Tax=Trichonephila clavata TaxID=2740835 RepID=A0A8X6GCJ6_TRICU|nr:hypothetical protein TNCT_674401 [Trichonephila clavata]